MNSVEFNEKWSDYLADRHYGLSFNHPEIVSWLDQLFTELKEREIEFKYYQIKFKFGDARFYSTLPSTLNQAIESRINRMSEVHVEKDKKHPLGPNTSGS